MPHGRTGDHEHPEAGHQHQQRRRHPRGERGHQRRGDRVPDKAARRPDGGRAGRRMRCALRDVNKPDHPDKQGGPADGGAGGLRVAVGMPHEPPAEQPQQHRDHERAVAEEPAGEVVDHPAGGVVHADPDTRREHDRQPEAEQPGAVPLVVWVQVPRASPDVAHGEADRPGDQHPARDDGAEYPPGENDYRIAGRPLPAPLARRALLPAAGGSAPSFARTTGRSSPSATSCARVGRPRRAAARPGGRGRLGGLGGLGGRWRSWRSARRSFPRARRLNRSSSRAGRPRGEGWGVLLQAARRCRTRRGQRLPARPASGPSPWAHG